MITPDQEREILASLLGKKGVDAFDGRALARKAHWRWDRDQHLAAAVLFDAASRRPGGDFNSRVRACARA